MKLKRLGLVLLFLGIGNYSFSQSVSFIPNGSLTGVTSSGTSTTFTVPVLFPDGTAAAPGWAFANEPDLGCSRVSGNIFRCGPSQYDTTWQVESSDSTLRVAGLWFGTQGTTITNSDTHLTRDAANTLALRNSTNAQTFNIYNTYTDASNYERLEIIAQPAWNRFLIATGKLGTGTARNLVLFSSGGQVQLLGGAGAGWTLSTGGAFYPNTTDSYPFGGSANQITEAHISRSIQGSKSKALTESSATSFTRVAVPQTAGANHAAGKVIYEVYATDGTDSQSLVGEVYFSAVNKAGTETCSIGLVGTEILAVSAVSTLTCTHTCASAAADTVDISSNCVSSLAQTTFTIQSRLDMPQPNTVTPR